MTTLFEVYLQQWQQGRHKVEPINIAIEEAYEGNFKNVSRALDMIPSRLFSNVFFNKFCNSDSDEIMKQYKLASITSWEPLARAMICGRRDLGLDFYKPFIRDKLFYDFVYYRGREIPPDQEIFNLLHLDVLCDDKIKWLKGHFYTPKNVLIERMMNNLHLNYQLIDPSDRTLYDIMKILFSKFKSSFNWSVEQVVNALKNIYDFDGNMEELAEFSITYLPLIWIEQNIAPEYIDTNRFLDRIPSYSIEFTKQYINNLNYENISDSMLADHILRFGWCDQIIDILLSKYINNSLRPDKLGFLLLKDKRSVKRRNSI